MFLTVVFETISFVTRNYFNLFHAESFSEQILILLARFRIAAFVNYGNICISLAIASRLFLISS